MSDLSKMKPDPDIEEAEEYLVQAVHMAPDPSLETVLKLAELYLQVSIARSLHEMNRVGLNVFTP